MKQINQICHYGLTERAEKTKEVVVSILLEFKKFVSEKFSSQVMEVVGRHFPEDQYVTLAKSTKAVFERRQAPSNKFSEGAYELELAAITAGSANLSRRAVSNINAAVNELRLLKTVGLPTRGERITKFVFHQLAVPTVKWVLGITATVIGAILLYLLGIKG